MLERRIEEASLNSWPALQQMLFDGWLLRFARGYTKRANSVTPLYTALQPLQEKIEACEKVYRRKRQPTIFRLPSFLSLGQELDHLLSEREYQYVDRTMVLTRELEASIQMHDPAIREVSLATWLEIFCQLSQSPIEKHQAHQEMLARIAARSYFAVLYVGMIPVACALGVLENEVFGLFDIITAPEQRAKGYGTRLISEMLSWAWQNKATSAYLQVVDNNLIALRAYERLGFQELYHYWYRVRPYSA